MKREGSAAQNVLELNCRVVVSREKGDYVGREAVEEAMDGGLKRRIVGIRCDESACLPEIGASVRYGGEEIGEVVAADRSYGLDNSVIGLAFISLDYAYAGCTYQVDGVGAVQTVSAPFLLNRSLMIRPQEDSIHTVDWSIIKGAAVATA